MGKNIFIFKLISYILHPIFIPLYITILYIRIFKQILTDELSEYLLSLIIIGTLALPLLTIFLLLNTKLINSILLETQKERIIPIISTGIYIYVTAKLLMAGNLNSPLNSYLIGIVVTLSWILIFSRRMKISLHTAAISSALGFLIYLSNIFLIDLQPLIIVFIITLGFISTARIKLEAHTYKEIAIGILFGIVPQLGFVYLY